MHDTGDNEALFNEEAKLFGAAGDEKTSCKSPLSVAVFSETKPVNYSLKELPKMPHEECERQNNIVDPLLYLAGMGLLQPGNRIKTRQDILPCRIHFHTLNSVSRRKPKRWLAWTMCSHSFRPSQLSAVGLGTAGAASK